MVKKLRMSKDEMAAYDYAKEVAVKQMQASCLSLMLKEQACTVHINTTKCVEAGMQRGRAGFG